MGPDRDFEPTRQKLIISNILMAQFFIMKIKVLLMHYKIKCLTSMKTLKFGQTKLTRCISMLFGLLLATKGIGASLQHYNPIVDESTASQFDIPNTWKLIAQMPFGDVRESANEKEIKPVEDRFIIKK